MNIVMAMNNIQTRAMELREMWRAAEEGMENLLGDILQRFQIFQEEQANKQAAEDMKDSVSDSSTLVGIKLSTSPPPQDIHITLKHESCFKVLKVKDCSTQVHLKDFYNSESSGSKFDEASNPSPKKNKAKKNLTQQRRPSNPLRTLEWLNSIPPPPPSPVNDHDESWRSWWKNNNFSGLVELTPICRTTELTTLIYKCRNSSYETPYARRLRQSVLFSSFKEFIYCPREASNKRNFNSIWDFSFPSENCWNCGSWRHDYSACYLPKRGFFCFSCGKNVVTPNKCLKCSESPRIVQEYPTYYNCGAFAVDISG